jgi:hypothetical protein
VPAADVAEPAQLEAAEPEPAQPEPAPAPEPVPAAGAAAGAVAAAGGAFLQSVTHLQGASDLEAAGAAALQAGDYVEAIRQYGAALRRLRAGGDGAPGPGEAARGERA